MSVISQHQGTCIHRHPHHHHNAIQSVALTHKHQIIQADVDVGQSSQWFIAVCCKPDANSNFNFIGNYRTWHTISPNITMTQINMYTYVYTQAVCGDIFQPYSKWKYPYSNPPPRKPLMIGRPLTMGCVDYLPLMEHRGVPLFTPRCTSRLISTYTHTWTADLVKQRHIP